MKNVTRFFIPGVLSFISLILLTLTLGTCENDQLQELLYGPSLLENLTVKADDAQAYNLRPIFKNDTFEYTSAVPPSTRFITVDGFAHRAGKVRYSCGDGTAYGNETSSGRFEFPLELDEIFIKIRVIRPYMEEAVYTLRIVRGADFLLRDIEVRAYADINNISENERTPRGLTPAFTGEESSYEVSVTYSARWLNMKGIVNPIVEPAGGPKRVNVYYNLNTAVAADALLPDNSEGITVEFPDTAESITIYVQARPVASATGTEDADEDGWENYCVVINRSRKVRAHEDTVKIPGYYFEIFGGADTPNPNEKAFGPGDPVSFRLAPPFGYEFNTIELVHIESGEKKYLPVSESQIYVFLMPVETVEIRVVYTEIPKAAHTNVRYVSENGTGSGMSWADATSDLQRLIDEYVDTAGDPNNYEIWVAGGTYTPDWTSLSAAAIAGWANNFGIPPPTQKGDELYWAFVLTEGVRIFGGFSGREVTQQDMEHRDIKANETILSGNIQDKNTGVITRTVRVMIAAGINFAYMEGLTLEGPGNVITYLDSCFVNGIEIDAIQSGVMFIAYASPIMKNIIFKNGRATFNGGLTIGGDAKPVLIGCEFSYNQDVASNGSAIDLYSGTLNDTALLMIGGTVSQNWGSTNVIRNTNGNMVLINLMIKDNMEHPIHTVNQAHGAVTLVNSTIINNRGSEGWGGNPSYAVDAYTGFPYAGAASMYNCVVKDNYDPDGLLTIQVDPGISLFNSIATGHSDSLDDHDTLLDRGINNHYPVYSTGAWNILSPVYAFITDIINNFSQDKMDFVRSKIVDALLKDVNGNDRFRGVSVDIGAEEN